MISREAGNAIESGHRHQNNIIRTRSSRWEMGSDSLFSLGGSRKPFSKMVLSSCWSSIAGSGSFFLFLKCDIVKNNAPYVKLFRIIFVYIGENLT